MPDLASCAATKLTDLTSCVPRMQSNDYAYTLQGLTTAYTG